MMENLIWIAKEFCLAPVKGTKGWEGEDKRVPAAFGSGVWKNLSFERIQSITSSMCLKPALCQGFHLPPVHLQRQWGEYEVQTLKDVVKLFLTHLQIPASA